MLYKFKSQAAADVIMLGSNARQILKIIGKDDDPTGIVTVAQVPAALAALQAAIRAHETAQQTEPLPAQDEGEHEGDGVMLRQRALPFMDLLRRSAEAGKDVVWGV